MVQMPDFGKVGVKWPELQAAAEKLEDLEGQRDRATRKLNQLRSSKPEVEAADRKAFADALIAGKGKPKKSEAAKLEARIAAEQERAAALDLAVSTVKRDLLRIAAGEAGAAKRDEIVARLPEVQERVREAGDALLAAVREVDALAAAYAWIAAPDRPHTPPMNRVRVQDQTFSAEAAIRGIVGRAYRIEERKPEAETSDTDVAREPQRAGQHA